MRLNVNFTAQNLIMENLYKYGNNVLLQEIEVLALKPTVVIDAEPISLETNTNICLFQLVVNVTQPHKHVLLQQDVPPWKLSIRHHVNMTVTSPRMLR